MGVLYIYYMTIVRGREAEKSIEIASRALEGTLEPLPQEYIYIYKTVVVTVVVLVVVK